MNTIVNSPAEGWWMFFDTFWALVLGFGLSGAVQAFVSKGEMQRVLGDHRPATVARSTFFGMVSSSCSYAASALAKSLFSRGADFTSSMVFMFASTNLVIELGIVLWLLMMVAMMLPSAAPMIRPMEMKISEKPRKNSKGSSSWGRVARLPARSLARTWTEAACASVRMPAATAARRSA